MGKVRVLTDARPKGMQYRELYEVQQDRTLDSEFFRMRLAALLDSKDEEFALRQMHLQDLFTRSMGVPKAFSLQEMIMKAPRGRLLSFLTVLHAALVRQAEDAPTGYHGNAYFAGIARAAPAKFRSAIATLFHEERMAYEIDDKGGVHASIDAEFQRNRQAAIHSLLPARYTNVRSGLEAAFQRLAIEHFDTKAAVRDIFDAAESLFKMIVAPRNPNLSEGSVKDDLKPVINRAFAREDAATQQAAARSLSSFGKWADACHPYRHGVNSETIVAPPADLTILLLSQGAGFVRWLAKIDGAIQSAGS